MKLKLTFLEREFFADNRTGTHIKGYEPAVRVHNGKVEFGHVIDPERLKTAESIETRLAEMGVSLDKNQTDLTERLEATECGRTWLDSHRRLYHDKYNSPVPMTLTVEPLPMIPMRCTIFPPDYFERIERNRCYQSPEAVIERLAHRAVYAKVRPPMKFATGRWIPGVAYNRVVHVASSELWECGLDDANSTSFSPVQGVVFGAINETDVTERREGFKKALPARGFLEVVYLVGIRDTEHNPLSIRVELVEDKDNSNNNEQKRKS